MIEVQSGQPRGVRAGRKAAQGKAVSGGAARARAGQSPSELIVLASILRVERETEEIDLRAETQSLALVDAINEGAGWMLGNGEWGGSGQGGHNAIAGDDADSSLRTARQQAGAQCDFEVGVIGA